MQDFIIIGGGIAGISAAARLSHLGSVTVLERETALGYHASGRSAALFEETYGLPPVVALNRASKDFHFGPQGAIAGPRGLLTVAKADQQDAFRRDLAVIGLDALSVTEAQAMVPILNPATVAFAGYHAGAWDIDTDRLIQNFARTARSGGGSILTGAGVSAIRRLANGWEVETSQGVFAGRILVNAAGAWVDQVAVMAGVRPLGFTPYRRSMARIAAPGGHDLRGWPMLFGTGEDWYAKPDAGKLLVSPAEEHLMEPHDAFADDMVLAEGLARYEEMVTEPVNRVLSSWAGLRTFAPDRVLVIGFDPGDSAFFWLAGQGGYGFQTAPAASALASDLVAARVSDLSPDMVGALSPRRLG